MKQALVSQLRKTFHEKGRMIALASRNHICELADDLERHHADGEIAEAIWGLYLSNFVYSSVDRLPNARFVMLVASPAGRTDIILETAAGSIELTIPPTYGVEDLVVDNEAILASALEGSGVGCARARLPERLFLDGPLHHRRGEMPDRDERARGALPLLGRSESA